MKILFGTFLIEQGYLSSEALLTALIRQLQSTPTFAEVIFQKQLLPNESLLRILDLQQMTGREFEDCTRELGFFNDELNTAVQREVARARRPIGSLLVEGGHLSLPELTLALDLYLAQSGDAKVNVVDETKRVQLLKHSEHQLNPTLIPEYMLTFSQSFAPSADQTIANLRSHNFQDATITDLMQAAQRDFVGMRAAARFLGAINVGGICEKIIAVLAELKLPTDQEFLSKTIEYFQSGVGIIAKLTKNIEYFGCEAPDPNDRELNTLASSFSKIHDQLTIATHRATAE